MVTYKFLQFHLNGSTIKIGKFIMKKISETKKEKENKKFLKKELKIGDTILLKSKEQISISRNHSYWDEIGFEDFCISKGGLKFKIVKKDNCGFSISNNIWYPYQMIEKIVDTHVIKQSPKRPKKIDISKLEEGSLVKLKTRKQMSDSGTKRNYWNGIFYDSSLLDYAETVVKIEDTSKKYFGFWSKNGKVYCELPYQIIEKVISYKKK